MNQATEKQLNQIIYLTERHGDPAIRAYFENLPKNSEDCPDTRADYRRVIFFDRLRAAGWSILQAHRLIYFLNNNQTEQAKAMLGQI